MQKALLIDGNSLIYRIYYAQYSAKLNNEDLNLKRQVLKTLYYKLFSITKNPYDFQVVAFDASKQTQRSDVYSDYKSNRKPMPQELVDLLPDIHQIFQDFGFCIMRHTGIEADDFVGSCRSLFNKYDIQCDIYSGDKDLLQLINEQSTVYLFQNYGAIKRYDTNQFMAQYGFMPLNLIDFKALAGDSSDNYKGVRGVSENSAKYLVQQYQTVENLYSHLDDLIPCADLKKATITALYKGQKDALLCKELATIKTTIFYNELNSHNGSIEQIDQWILNKVKSIKRNDEQLKQHIIQYELQTPLAAYIDLSNEKELSQR